jgi:hypothetical protein
MTYPLPDHMLLYGMISALWILKIRGLHVCINVHRQSGPPHATLEGPMPVPPQIYVTILQTF